MLIGYKERNRNVFKINKSIKQSKDRRDCDDIQGVKFHVWQYDTTPRCGGYREMTVIDLIKELNKRTKDKNLVIYSNKNKLTNYDFLDVYENEGQVEIHISEGEKLEK